MVASSSAGASATPLVVTHVSSPAQAAAVVLASNPMFESVSPSDQSVIGQSAWYDVSENGDGFSVSVTMGSGDCPAGCITQHTWTYSVGRDGTVELVGEQGDKPDVTIDLGTSDPATVVIRLVAGPVCPVERDPPDPSCAPRPVPDTQVVLRDPTGADVAHGTTDADGQASFTVPGGAYYAEPGGVESVMGQATAEAFSVPGGRTATVTLEYDTGIR